jgi:hypothetical protein
VIVNLEWYRKFLVVFAVAIFFTSICDFTEQHGVNALTWIILMAVLTAPVLIQAVFDAHYRWQPVLVWGLGYLLISIIWYFPATQNALDFRQLRLRFLSVLFLFLMLFVFSRPRDILLARQAVAAAVLFDVSLTIYELFHPMTFSTLPGRSSALYSNVNQTGCALVLGMIVSKDVVPKRFRFPFCVLTGIGVVTTFSRSAIVGWILLMGYSAVRSGVSLTKIGQALVALGLVFAFFTSSTWQNMEHTLVERGALNGDVMQRLKFFSQGNTQDGSSVEREAVAAYAFNLFEQKPLLGWGTGVGRDLEAFPVGAHNIYLALMIDHGVLGALLVPWLLLAVVWGCRRKVFDVAIPFVAFVALWGFFSHNVLEERYLLLTVALTASMVVQERRAAAGRAEVSEPAQFAPGVMGAFA